MANLTPIVDPLVNSSGNPITTFPKVTFEKAIDVGSVNESNFFIISLRRVGDPDQDNLLQVSNAISDIVPAQLEYRKVNPANDNTFTGTDDGSSAQAGGLYRSEITLKPKHPLRPNTNYAVIVSKHTSLLTVFDAKANPSNTGTGKIKTAGVYTGLTADQYTITITQAGDRNEAYYTWKRQSDNFTSDEVQARGRHIEIDKEVKVKFDSGEFNAGDRFTIIVKPADKLLDIFSWNFTTGTGEYKVPADEKSNDSLNLPVVNPNVPAPPVAGDFHVVSIEPTLGASLVKIASKAIATLYGVVIQSKINTDIYNGWKFEFVNGGTAGAELVTFTAPNLIKVQVQENVSTTKQVVDALNASALVNVNFEAFTACPTGKVTAGKTRITKGVLPNTVVITFSKNIDPASVGGNIKLTHSDVYPASAEEELYFSTSVAGNKLTLTIED